MDYKDLDAHIDECIQKEIPCPLSCTTIITSFETGVKHFETCPNVLIKCDNCET